MEYRAVPAYAGSDPHAINPVLVQLMQNLAPNQARVLRIGGDSTDWTWWPTPGQRKPAGVSFGLSRNWLAGTRALAQATDSRLILGINLEANRPTVAAIEARELLAGIGRQRVQALEIGNEPDLYGVFPWNHTPAGRPVLGRAAGYDFGGFSNEFARIRRSLPQIPLAGPASGDLSWLSNLPKFLAAEPSVREVTFHRYALNRCNKVRRSPSYPTVPNLLAPVSTLGLMNGAGPVIAAAHRRGIPFRVDEMNAVTCGGVWGVSNSFASALWSLDAMFAVLRSGADGVNVQTSPFPGTPNQLFTFRHPAGHWVGSVRPEYYGLLMFAQAAPPGSRLLQVAAPANDPVHSWATRTPSGQIHLVLINDSFTRARSLLVRAPMLSVATLERLQAPSPYSTHGITLAGQSFAPQSTTGALSGPMSTTTVKPARGEYALKLPAGSAAMLTISRPAARKGGRRATPPARKGVGDLGRRPGR